MQETSKNLHPLQNIEHMEPGRQLVAQPAATSATLSTPEDNKPITKAIIYGSCTCLSKKLDMSPNCPEVSRAPTAINIPKKKKIVVMSILGSNWDIRNL